MNAVVCVEIALGCKCSSTHSAFEWPFSGMGAVMHFKGTLTAKNPVADCTLIGVSRLLVNVLH